MNTTDILLFGGIGFLVYWLFSKDIQTSRAITDYSKIPYTESIKTTMNITQQDWLGLQSQVTSLGSDVFSEGMKAKLASMGISV